MSDLDETGWALGEIKPRKRNLYGSDGAEDDDRIGLFPVEFVRMAQAGETEHADERMEDGTRPPQEKNRVLIHAVSRSTSAAPLRGLPERLEFQSWPY